MKNLFMFMLLCLVAHKGLAQANFLYDPAGNRIQRAPLPDLTSSIYIDNLNFSSNSVGVARDFIVIISEVNHVATSGTIQFVIAKLSAFTISYPTSSGTSYVLGGIPNTNSDWTFSEDSFYIRISTTIPISGFGSKFIGFSITRNPGIPANTSQSINVTLVPNTGGEANFSNNIYTTTVTTN